MKRILKDNLAIVAAIALPLLLVIVFAFSTLVISKLVADPQFDFLFATNFHGGANEAFYFEVVQDRLRISYAYPATIAAGGYQNSNAARLWRVRVPAMTVEEIPLAPPGRTQDTVDGQRVPLEIPGVSGLRLVNSQPAPDGYVFEPVYDHYGGNLMREIFAGPDRRHRPACAIVKNGRALPVSHVTGDYYGYYNTRFIGWILKNQ